jgi:hypothetical protein
MNKRVGQILRINVSIPLWAVLTFAVVVFLTAYICKPEQRDHIKFAAALLGGAAAIYSAYYVGAALRLQLNRHRQQASFDILNLLNRPETAKVRNFVETEVEGHEQLSPNDLYRKVTENRDLDDAVTIVLGILEDASIAIQNDFVDENILYASLDDIVKRCFHALRAYVEQLRKQRAEPLYFVEVEKLCASWDSGRRLADGKTLPKLGG